MEQEMKSKHSDYFNRKIIEAGAVAGVLLLLFSWLSYVFRFLTWNPFSSLSFIKGPDIIKHGIALIVIVAASIFLALLYNVLLGKRKPFSTGIGTAFLVFAAFLFFINHEILHLVTAFSLILGYCLFLSTTISWIHEQGK